jgi:hypothetical protein
MEVSDQFSLRFLDALNFLQLNLGDPPFSEQEIVVDIADAQNGFGHFSISRSGERIIRIPLAALSASDGVQYIVHELVHAIYQDDSWVRYGSDFDVEGIAAWAQFLYQQDLSSSTGNIADEIHRVFPSVDDPQIVALYQRQRFSNLSAEQRLGAYASAAYPLLRLGRSEVFLWYRRRMLGIPRPEPGQPTEPGSSVESGRRPPAAPSRRSRLVRGATS